MGLGGIAAHDQHNIGVLDVNPVVVIAPRAKRRGRLATVGPCQTRA